MVQLLHFLFLLPVLSQCALITVKTSRGSIQGFDHDMGGDSTKRFYGYGQVFLGIPFAKAPLGSRRFSLPEDICQYNGNGEVHNATYYRPRCWQVGMTEGVDEDCLYLNVVTPNITGNYPVMVYIHGGTFTTGGAETYHWKGAIRNLVSRGVVVITIQYRIGFLGFFTTYTDKFPPNRGIYDQIIALRWVNEEISNFGGNPDKVTIFGQSSGAVSVSDLSLSPLARGLFHQVIQESSAALTMIQRVNDPNGSIHQERARQICDINATDWGSPEKDRTLMECLVKAEAHELVDFDMSDHFAWVVTLDGAVLPDYPEKLAKTRPKYPALLGDMLDDFAGFLVIDGDLSFATPQYNQWLLQFNMPWMDNATAAAVNGIMEAGYSQGQLPADDDHLGWAKLNSDANVNRTWLLIYDHPGCAVKAGNDDVWLFTFAHKSKLNGANACGWMPVGHGAELPYIWFYPSVWENSEVTAGDLAVADYMGALWTYFAKHGELPYDRAGKEMNYLEIRDLLELKSNWRQEADEVYNKQIPKYLGEYPPLHMSEEKWEQLRQLGERVLAKWNSLECPA